MQQKELRGLRVAILVHDEFEQSEMTDPRNALEQAGASTVLVSDVKGPVYGLKNHEKADTFEVDLPMDKANPKDFDAVLLPGGALNADKLRMVKQAQEFVRDFDREGKPIAVICHGPWLLVSAGLVKGRRLAAYYTIQDDIRNAGGEWIDEKVVRDDNWVSSRQPADLPAFNSEMVNLFSERVAAMDRQQRAA